jgi:hypothetical protein
VQLSTSSDPRLLAGLSGAVNHLAETAGLNERARAELVAAIEDACRDALSRAADKQRIELLLEVWPGKIEAVLEYHCASETPAEITWSAVQQALRLRLDSVRRESNSGITRLTLIKRARRGV